MHDTHFVLLFFQLACSKTIQLKIDFHQNFLFFDNSYSSLKHCKSIIYLKKWNFIGWSSVHIDQWKECFKTALQIIYYLSFVIFDSCGLVVYLILFDFHPLNIFILSWAHINIQSLLYVLLIWLTIKLLSQVRLIKIFKFNKIINILVCIIYVETIFLHSTFILSMIILSYLFEFKVINLDRWI